MNKRYDKLIMVGLSSFHFCNGRGAKFMRSTADNNHC